MLEVRGRRGRNGFIVSRTFFFLCSCVLRANTIRLQIFQLGALYTFPALIFRIFLSKKIWKFFLKTFFEIFLRWAFCLQFYFLLFHILWTYWSEQKKLNRKILIIHITKYNFPTNFQWNISQKYPRRNWYNQEFLSYLRQDCCHCIVTEETSKKMVVVKN